MERGIQDIAPSENTVKERRKFEDIVEFLILDTALAFIVILLLVVPLYSWIVSDVTETYSDFDEPSIQISWGESVFMPRHEECIDPSNGQDPGYEASALDMSHQYPLPLTAVCTSQPTRISDGAGRTLLCR